MQNGSIVRAAEESSSLPEAILGCMTHPPLALAPSLGPGIAPSILQQARAKGCATQMASGNAEDSPAALNNGAILHCVGKEMFSDLSEF